MKNKIFIASTCILLGLVSSITAQHPFKLELVKDINPNGGSSPRAFVLLNDKIYFTADDGTGRGLWVCDGTTQETYLLIDINPNGDENIQQLTKVNDKLFFTADDGIHGHEVWVSDGTTNGTHLVKDINTTGSSSISFNSGIYNGELYFTANDGIHGKEIWKTDGNTVGTMMLKDIDPTPYDPVSPSFPYIQGGKVYQNRMYFTASDSVHGFELWSTDGTEAGTYMLKDINPDGDGYPVLFHEYKGKLYFNATDSNGSELWVTDGTEQGTRLFADIVPSGVLGDPSSNPHSFKEYNGDLYFPVQPSTSFNQKLYRTDGVIVEEVLMPLLSVTWNNWSTTIYNDKLYFSGLTEEYGAEPWVTDGTFSGTKLTVDVDTTRLSIFGGTFGSGPSHFFQFEGYLLFKARGALIGRQIWVMNDKDYSQVDFLRTHKPVSHNAANSFSKIVIGDYCYLTGNYDGSGTELWRMYDSTKVNGVEELKTENLHQVELYPNPSGSLFVTLKYQLQETGNVTIQLYDVSGKWIQTIGNQKEIQGNHQIEISLENIPKGMYLIKLQTAQGTQTLKFIRSN